MKKSDNFQISSAWWKREKPGALLKSGLGEALTAYEAAKNGLRHTTTSFMRAKTALDAVEAARLKALKNCGLIFPDCQAVLKKGDAVIKAERTALDDDYRTKCKAEVLPVQRDLVKFAAKCKADVETAAKLVSSLPKAGSRMGKTPFDEKSLLMEKVAKKAAEIEYLLSQDVSLIGDLLSDGQQAIVLAAKDPTLADFNAAVDKARKTREAAVKLRNALSGELDAWEHEIKAVDKDYELKRLYQS